MYLATRIKFIPVRNTLRQTRRILLDAINYVRNRDRQERNRIYVSSAYIISTPLRVGLHVAEEDKRTRYGYRKRKIGFEKASST